MRDKLRIAIYLQISQEDGGLEMGGRRKKESNSISSQRKYVLEYLSRNSRLANSEVIAFYDDGFTRTNMEWLGKQACGATITLDTAFQTLLYDLYSKDVSVKVKAFFDSKCAGGEYVFGQVALGYKKGSILTLWLVVNWGESAAS